VIIPKIGLGTWNIKTDDLVNIIPEAIKLGYRHFDTARKYSNEEGVGEGIRKSGIDRNKVFITTKLWITDFLRTKNAFEASLERLQVDYVDLYLIHWPFPFWTKAWVELERIQSSGKAKSIGVSNFGIKELEYIKNHYKIIPAVNQIEFSPFFYKKELIKYCQKEGIQVEAYSPLTRGYRLDDPKIQIIADKYQRTIPQILLAWCLHHNLIVLPKSTTIEHLKENFESQNIKLLKPDMEYLDSLNENYSALSTFWSKKK
jgi:diketogulonate reductase-like aldo/keto reductase